MSYLLLVRQVDALDVAIVDILGARFLCTLRLNITNLVDEEGIPVVDFSIAMFADMASK
jgi:hypothetical protein